MKHSKYLSIILIIGILSSTFFLSSCRKEQQPEQDESEEVIVLRAVSLGTPPSAGLDSFYEQLDKLTIEDFGCVLRFDYIPWGDERKQINIAIASGEYDFIPGGVFSDYRLMIPKNAFLDLSEYLYLVPDLVEHYRKNGRDVLEINRVDGKLYGIPQYGLDGVDASEGFLFREDLRREWGLEPVTGLETMEAYLYRAKQEEQFADMALITDNRIWTSLWYMLSKDTYFEIENISDTQYSVVSIDEPYTVLSRLETPEFLEVLKYISKWYNDGILEGELLASQGNEGTRGLELLVAGLKPCESNAPIWSINNNWIPKLYETHPEWEFGFFSYQLDSRKSNYKYSSNHGTVISISNKTQYPETAVRILEKLHTDQRYYDLLVYGVEGEHYHFDESGGVAYDGIKSENMFSAWTGAVDEFMSYPGGLSPNKAWSLDVFIPTMDKISEKSEIAEFCPLDNFIFDKSDVVDVTDELSKAWIQYVHPLLCGIVIEDIESDYYNAVAKLKEAGLDEYNNVIQEQLNIYKLQ